MNRPLYILISMVVLLSCSSDKMYNLESLNTDISEFNDADQMRIVEFSSRYEKGRNFYDSIDGVPVVLVQSLTYKELLQKIKAYEDRQMKNRIEFSWRVIRQLGMMSEQVDTLRLPMFDNPVILFEQRELQLPIEIRLSAGRGFSPELDKDSSVVIISRTIANLSNFQLGDTIMLDREYKIIGVTTDIDIIKPYDPTFFAIKSNL